MTEGKPVWARSFLEPNLVGGTIMTEASKPSSDVRTVRVLERERQKATGTGIGGEGRTPGRGIAVEGGSAEAELCDQLAELRASGLACDRW